MNSITTKKRKHGLTGEVKHSGRLARIIRRDYQLYLLALPAVVFLFIFHYIPMYGVQIAFKNFVAVKGIWGSPWVGFDHFVRFFNSYQFGNLLKNTVVLSFYQLLATFPTPILLALVLNHVKHRRFKSFVQNVTYAPHFISVVVMVGLLNLILSPSSGFVNTIIKAFGQEPIAFMSEPGWYKHIYVLSAVCQNTGFLSVVYIAALSSINPELYEAAKMDGASTWKQILHVDIPGILPTIVTLLILNTGSVMNLGFQKAFLMQNPLTEQSQEIIATYVYKVGLINSEYSYSTAIGLFNTLVNITLLLTVNAISKKVTDTSLW